LWIRLGVSTALRALQLRLQGRNVVLQLLPTALYCDQPCVRGLQLPFQFGGLLGREGDQRVSHFESRQCRTVHAVRGEGLRAGLGCCGQASPLKQTRTVRTGQLVASLSSSSGKNMA